MQGLHKVKGGARVAFQDEFGAAEEREVLCEAQQGRSGVKRKLFGSFRNKIGDVRTLIMEETRATKYSICPGIRENIANYRSSLRDVFIPLAEPFSIMALEGTGGTSDIVPVTPDTTTDLSMVVASTNIVRLISIDGYEVAGTDDQETVDGNVADEDANPFLNVDGVELNVPE
nr:hypothetical protein [Tanacetum cinerariifolium]